MDNENKELTKEEVNEVLDFCRGFYEIATLGKFSNYIYNTQQENKTLIDLNNNPRIPTEDSLRKAIADYKNQASNLQDYSEFISIWDGIYNKVLNYYANLLAIDINRVVVNIDDNKEFNSEEYAEDCKRVDLFLENFNAKQEFRNVVKNVLKTDTYYCWLRETTNSNDKTDITDINNPKSYSLQMMPQSECKITGKFNGKGINGFLWDFNLNYFNDSNVNINNYDKSLISAFRKMSGKIGAKNYNQLKNLIIDNNRELNNTNNYLSNNYVRTKIPNGAWVFKYNFDNFNTVPPFAYLLKSVFNDDVIERLQKDKDIISAQAIILGEMKTRDKETVGNDKSSFTISPTVVGQLMRLARNGINRNIKQIALPLEETRLYQFADNNSNMYKNKLKSSAGLGAYNSPLLYTDEKLSQEEAQMACSVDFNSIANSLYPQFENFLNYFVNKTTKKYKFKFTVSGSTLPFLRKNEFDNFLKLSDKGIQVPLRKWGTLLGMDGQQFEMMVKEAKFSNTEDLLFSLLNSNTNFNEIGNTEKDNSELNEGGAISREYR